ncbi:hypothetical protein GWQ44_08375 [Pseudomonas sp. 3MA1]|uniref:hypothetical protein n=1 Tax=Pseudomonas sp. 3MA1 TaxID=2699196 RepID=UPI0023DDFB86|nr:hypothetical protein [Pseudomonas sp. 3MA1]MDF2395552.1 hypothetical protein [Pseudomonas sp. 3MA1]
MKPFPIRAALCGCIALALSIPLIIWTLGRPIDSSHCSDTVPGPLSEFISQYFRETNGAHWQEEINSLIILGIPEAQALARQSPAHYCDALNLLENPQRAPTEKFHTAVLMLSLPIDYYLDLMDRSHQLYQRGLIDRSVLSMVLMPRGTALNYWWLPQWRSRFQRDAPGLFSDDQMREILRGEHWFDYPGRGY